MPETSIEWTDRSINPIQARRPDGSATGHYCEKLSSGCANCYASRLQTRFRMPAFPGHGKYPGTQTNPGNRKPTTNQAPSPLGGEGKGEGALRFEPSQVLNPNTVHIFYNSDRLKEVLRRRIPTKWFWCDMTDLFGHWVPDGWIDQCFAVMALTPHHTHQILTKRPERMARYLGDPATRDRIKTRMVEIEFRRYGPVLSSRFDAWKAECRAGTDQTTPWPLPNVWLGTSCEDQSAADLRIPHLLNCPAAIRFLSCEPLLGPIDLTWISPEIEVDGVVDCLRGRNWVRNDLCGVELPSYLYGDGSSMCRQYLDPYKEGPISWVIVGGESGPKARPMHPDWARSLRDQCQTAKVHFFFKQWGEWCPATEQYGVSGNVMPDDGKHFRWIGWRGHQQNRSANGLMAPVMAIARQGKHLAGRLLDNRTWDEFPEAANA